MLFWELGTTPLLFGKNGVGIKSSEIREICKKKMAILYIV